MNNTINIKLRKFDMSKVGDNRTLCFIGKRNTGKSVLVLDYLYNNPYYFIGNVISPTDEYNKTYSKHIPSIFIHHEYDENILEEILKRQKFICAKCSSDPTYASMDPRIFLILDDCLADSKDWINSKNVKWLFMNGRHAQITFIITMQYLLGIPPSLRSNIDYVFISKETKTSNIKKLYEYYAGMFESMEMFKNILNQCTENYGCMVIDNTANSSNLADQVFWYRADSINQPDWKTFKICHKKFWVDNDLYLEATKEPDLEQPVQENYIKKSKMKFKFEPIDDDKNKY